MCGRFTQRYTWGHVHKLYDLVGAARNLQAHYNIAPTDTVEVVRPTGGGGNELVPMRWGLVPWWWKNPETGEPVISCTIIVTDANALTQPVHDRMPVILDKADIAPWLNGSAGTGLLRPAAEHRLRMWPISRRVNKTGTGDDDPILIDEVAA